MADLDGDGIRDVLSGSWPGELYVFRGRKDEDGTLTHEAATKIEHADGKPINTGNASTAFAVDWDRDGDLDLVVGSINGWVWFVPNESGSKELAFGEAVKMQAAGEPIHEHHAGPVVADWDGDGTLDLVVSQGDGKVVWYANSARAGMPRLAAARVLHEGAEHGRSDGSRCGGRVKPHVTDWNGDGRLDLLMGDFAVRPAEGKELDEAQQARLEALRARQRELAEESAPRSRALMVEVISQVLPDLAPEVLEDPMAVSKVFQALTDEQRTTFQQKLRAAYQSDEKLTALQEEQREVMQEMHGLTGRPTVVGHVWLRLRKAPAAPATDGSAGTQD